MPCKLFVALTLQPETASPQKEDRAWCMRINDDQEYAQFVIQDRNLLPI